MSSPHERLGRFLDEQMRMSQVYQPVMLEVLLTRGGRASIRSIAEAIHERIMTVTAVTRTGS